VTSLLTRMSRNMSSSLFAGYQPQVHPQFIMASENMRKRKQVQEMVEQPPSQFFRPLDSGPSAFVVNLVNNLYVEGLDAPRMTHTSPQQAPAPATHTPTPANPWVYRTKRHMVLNREQGFPTPIQIPHHPTQIPAQTKRIIPPLSLPTNPLTMPKTSMAMPTNPMAISTNRVTIPTNHMAIHTNPMAIATNPMAIPTNPMAIATNQVTRVITLKQREHNEPSRISKSTPRSIQPKPTTPEPPVLETESLNSPPIKAETLTTDKVDALPSAGPQEGKKPKRGPKPKYPEPAYHGPRIYSNNMKDCCKHECRICQKTKTLTAMRGHTKLHNMSIKEYCDLYGSIRNNIMREVWHRCELCEEDFLLDSDEVHKHAMGHRMSLKEYNAKFIILRQNQGKTSGVKKEKDDEEDTKQTIAYENIDNFIKKEREEETDDVASTIVEHEKVPELEEKKEERSLRIYIPKEKKNETDLSNEKKDKEATLEIDFQEETKNEGPLEMDLPEERKNVEVSSDIGEPDGEINEDVENMLTDEGKEDDPLQSNISTSDFALEEASNETQESLNEERSVRPESRVIVVHPADSGE